LDNRTARSTRVASNSRHDSVSESSISVSADMIERTLVIC
jgi:hypothetical protein